jgi:hypothetical protein
MLNKKDYNYLMGYYDILIDLYVNKYDMYYPIDPCIQDINTPNRKRHSMCSYCYSCYSELCETISKDYNLSVTTTKWNSKSIYEICNKVENIFITFYRDIYPESTCEVKHPPSLALEVEKIVNIINKYTNYNRRSSEACNLLHREFIESLMRPLHTLLWDYLIGEVLSGNYNYGKQNIIKKRNKLYKLNSFCIEVYYTYVCDNFKYTYFADNIAYNIIRCLYKRSKGKTK